MTDSSSAPAVVSVRRDGDVAVIALDDGAAHDVLLHYTPGPQNRTGQLDISLDREQQQHADARR